MLGEAFGIQLARPYNHWRHFSVYFIAVHIKRVRNSVERTLTFKVFEGVGKNPRVQQWQGADDLRILNYLLIGKVAGGCEGSGFHVV